MKYYQPHIYWCVSSSSDGNSELIKAKWLSLECHIHNIHTGHGALFPQCVHGELDMRKRII